eukprot:291072_1
MINFKNLLLINFIFYTKITFGINLVMKFIDGKEIHVEHAYPSSHRNWNKDLDHQATIGDLVDAMKESIEQSQQFESDIYWRFEYSGIDLQSKDPDLPYADMVPSIDLFDDGAMIQVSETNPNTIIQDADYCHDDIIDFTLASWKPKSVTPIKDYNVTIKDETQIEFYFQLTDELIDLEPNSGGLIDL